MDAGPILSVKHSATINTMITFNGDRHGDEHGDRDGIRVFTLTDPIPILLPILIRVSIGMYSTGIEHFICIGIGQCECTVNMGCFPLLSFLHKIQEGCCIWVI